MNSRESGLTLIEILVALGVFMLLGSSLVMFLRDGMSTWQIGESRREAYERAGAIMDLIGDDLNLCQAGNRLLNRREVVEHKLRHPQVGEDRLTAAGGAVVTAGEVEQVDVQAPFIQAIGEDGSLFQADHSFDLRDQCFHLMRDHHQGCPAAAESTEHPEQVVLGLEIKSIGRFVEHKHVRLMSQCPCNQHPTFLAIREVTERLVGKGVELQFWKQMIDPGGLPRGWNLIDAQADGSEKR